MASIHHTVGQAQGLSPEHNSELWHNLHVHKKVLTASGNADAWHRGTHNSCGC